MTIKTESELNTDFADNVNRDITEENLRDFAESVMAVGGTMYATNVSLDITANWAPITVFTDSIDTKGITEDLVNGVFTIGSGADGTYLVFAVLNIDSTFAGDISVALTKNGALTPYQSTYTVQTGIKVPFIISGSGNVAAGDTLGLGVKGSGSATVTLVHGSLRASRI